MLLSTVPSSTPPSDSLKSTIHRKVKPAVRWEINAAIRGSLNPAGRGTLQCQPPSPISALPDCVILLIYSVFMPLGSCPLLNVILCPFVTVPTCLYALPFGVIKEGLFWVYPTSPCLLAPPKATVTVPLLKIWRGYNLPKNTLTGLKRNDAIFWGLMKQCCSFWV